MAEIAKKSSPALVAVAWAVVSIPLAWGIYNTALNAAKLFTATSSAPAAASSTSHP
jgi:hypothetical protein